MKKLIGVDIGGTKISVGLIDPSGQVLAEITKPSLAMEREGLFNQVCQLVNQLLADQQLTPQEVALGIGVPGIVDAKQGLAIFQNNLDWAEFPLKQRLQDAFPDIEQITVDNDVIQAGIAEWQALDLGVEDTMVFLTISTGIASPVFYGGQALRGLGAAGEIGLIPVRTEFGKNFQRFEAACAGPAIALKAQTVYQDDSLTTADLFQRFNQNDPLAQGIVAEFIDSLAHGIYLLTSILDPQKIVLGGSVIKRNPGLLPLLKTALQKEIIPVQAKSIEALVLSTYDNNAGLIGAGLCNLA